MKYHHQVRSQRHYQLIIQHQRKLSSNKKSTNTNTHSTIWLMIQLSLSLRSKNLTRIKIGYHVKLLWTPRMNQKPIKLLENLHLQSMLESRLLKVDLLTVRKKVGNTRNEAVSVFMIIHSQYLCNLKIKSVLALGSSLCLKITLT